MRRMTLLLFAAVLTLSACGGDFHGSSQESPQESGFEPGSTLPESYGFSHYDRKPGCFKASAVPTAEPVADLASRYRTLMPDLGYRKNYEELAFTFGFEEGLCGKHPKAPKTWGRRRVAQVWSAAWVKETGIFCPTVWVTIWSTRSGDVYLHFGSGATCLL